MRFKTLSIHGGHGPDKAFGAVMMPIYQTSTYAFEKLDTPPEFDYSRSGNPTRKALEDCLAAIEGGTHGFVFGTGMAAELTALMLFNSGDHLIVHDDLYGGSYRLLTRVLSTKGIAIDFVNLRDLDAVQKAIRPNTKGMWIETPTNPLMNIIDLEAVVKIAKPRNILTFCDNTFLTPYFQRPLDFGVDVVMHSTTKYINGHSDVVGGSLIAKDKSLAERIYFLQNAMGTCAGPQDCFLVLRGVKTLALRMDEHNRSALAIARWLEKHPKIERVLHPGLESHPQHALAKKQMKGFGGTFSFFVKGDAKDTARLLDNLNVFTLAISLGGVESLIEHPWTMTHSSVPEDARAKMGITQNLVRISVGLEDTDDLIEDLEQAFRSV
jgi:cystathionine gamma-lyase